MTAAERATDAALAGAADHRAATGDGWLRESPETAPRAAGFQSDPRWRVEWQTCLSRPPSQVSMYICSRGSGHPGRHIAATDAFLCAAWPGTHEPTLADLDDPAPADAGQPPALALPDGWERINYSRGSRAGELSHCLRQASGLCEEDFYANPEPDGMVEMSGVAFELDEAKEVHARLGEAIRITEQLRAGAR